MPTAALSVPVGFTRVNAPSGADSCGTRPHSDAGDSTPQICQDLPSRVSDRRLNHLTSWPQLQMMRWSLVPAALRLDKPAGLFSPHAVFCPVSEIAISETKRLHQSNMNLRIVLLLFVGSALVQPIAATDPSYVSYHNEYRKLHGTPLLQYDANVAASAQAWADYCSTYNGNPAGSSCSQSSNPVGPGHSSSSTTPPTYAGAGENMGWTSATGDFSDNTYLDAVQRWYGEVKDYDYTTPGTGSGTIGHFTAVVWKATTHVGCGRTQG
eukprot:TRINITY_DN4561_c0_g1_i1.p1 TRINITY_DN4561_c0_g1~~TRINITY_DN4561_c0_g1_i1.p1  ORF type:complete len:267 (-),score=2.67 TRINITY_DN4561_c0_g1_i1:146-946(-)